MLKNISATDNFLGVLKSLEAFVSVLFFYFFYFLGNICLKFVLIRELQVMVYTVLLY